MKTANAVVLTDKELRDIFAATFKQRKQNHEAAAAAEARRDSKRPARLKAFWERLGYTPDPESDAKEAAHRRLLAMPPAEAWMHEHPEEVNLETCPTTRELNEITRNERRRLKATRLRLKGMGIR